MKDFLREKWKWIIAGVIILVVLLQFGGKTVTVINQMGIEFCEVYVSTSAELADWGPNRLGYPIKFHQSRDIHLPIYLTLFEGRAPTLYAWVVDCEGNVVKHTSFEEFRKSLVIWEVKP